jgi:hypothetical protein
MLLSLREPTMNLPAVAAENTASLPALIDRAVSVLNGARTAAEVLEARELASTAYDAAKRAARIGRARQAHDELIAKAHRTQAHALEIEAEAKRRLADEYDAAQDRGEVASPRDGKLGRSEPERLKPTAADLGISRKDIHEARLIRDAEREDPGIISRTVNAAVDAGEEPTRAKVRRAALQTVRPDAAPRPLRGRDAIAKRVCDAIIALSGLPPAHEVVGFLRETDASIIVDERIAHVATWVSEFSELWGEGTC